MIKHLDTQLQHFLLGLTLSIALMGATGDAWAAKLYKWVDEDGNISYQAERPPSNATVLEESELKTTTPTAASPSAVAAAAERNPVVVYTVANCDNCEILLLRLKQLGIPTSEQSLLNEEVQARILDLSGKLAAPTLFIGDRLIESITQDNLVEALDAAGYEVTPKRNPNADREEASVFSRPDPDEVQQGPATTQ
ncbi:MAG: DUF4124 domain-containing protein [Pseudomonadota bacterium]